MVSYKLSKDNSHLLLVIIGNNDFLLYPFFFYGFIFRISFKLLFSSVYSFCLFFLKIFSRDLMAR